LTPRGAAVRVGAMGAPGAPPRSGRPTSVADVIARLTAIDRRLPVTDGVAWFTKLYLKMTDGIQAAVVAGEFGAPEAVDTLGLVFAGLFLDVEEADRTGRGQPSKAWAPLYEARADDRIAPIQFALAGMNAHINRDLPVALVVTWQERGLGPRRGTPFHRDFETVNTIVARVEQEVKHWFATGFDEHLRHAFRGVDDEIANWSVEAARETAWANAELLWNLRDSPEITDLFVDTLDRFVGFAGRGLLVPTAPGPR